MNKNTQKLLKLRSDIIDDIYKNRWEEVWFFPEFKEIKGVKGFLGTDQIIFVALNPSFGTYPSEADRFYYRNLLKQGFGNAHLTDLFKLKRKNWSIEELLKNSKLLREAEKYLAKEIKIIKPKFIVFVGTSYRKTYEKVLVDLNLQHIAHQYIPHYALRFNNHDKRKKFRRELRNTRKKYLEILNKK